MISKNRVNNIDGLLFLSAFMVVISHVCANGPYNLSSKADFLLVHGGGIFAQFFFVLSGFCLCCGYYESFKNNSISFNDFYIKRLIRILPFFALIVFTDLIATIILYGFDWEYIAEGFSNLTLFFAFYPRGNAMSIVGVGWTLGVIFAFYIIFPFVVFMLWNKKRAWVSFLVSIGIFFVLAFYLYKDYESGICNIAFWLNAFLMGGLIYLYKDQIKGLIGKHIAIRITCLIILLGISVGYFFIKNSYTIYKIKPLIVNIIFALWLCYFVSFKSVIFENKFVKAFKFITYEIYLTHMIFYRIFERLNLLAIFNSKALSIIFASLAIFFASSLFCYIFKKFSLFISKKFLKN